MWQIKKHVKRLFSNLAFEYFFSLAVDESTDISGIALLPIFIRGVDSSLSMTGGLLDPRPMHGTTSGHD